MLGEGCSLLATHYSLLSDLLQLQRLDLDHDVLAARGILRRPKNDDVVVDVFLNLLGEQKLRDVEVGVSFAGLVVQRVIVRPARCEWPARGYEAPGELSRQGAATTVSEIHHGCGLAGGGGSIDARCDGRWSHGRGGRRSGCDGRWIDRTARDVDVAKEFFLQADLRPFSRSPVIVALSSFPAIASTGASGLGAIRMLTPGFTSSALLRSLFST